MPCLLVAWAHAWSLEPEAWVSMLSQNRWILLPNWLLDFTESPSQFTPLGGYLWLAVLGLTCHCTQTSQRLARTSLPVGVSLGGPPAALSDGSKRRVSGMWRTIVLALGTSFLASFQGLWKCCPRGECRRGEFPRRCIILQDTSHPLPFLKNIQYLMSKITRCFLPLKTRKKTGLYSLV